MTNSADPDPDQLASSDLHCLQRQGISGFSRTGVNNTYNKYKVCAHALAMFEQSISTVTLASQRFAVKS